MPDPALVDLILKALESAGAIAGPEIIKTVTGETTKDAYKALKQKIAQLLGRSTIDPLDPSALRAEIARAIDQRSVQDRESLRKLAKELLDTLAPPAPRLELALVVPEGGAYAIPKVASNALWNDRLREATDRMGLQSADWAASTIKQLDEAPNTASAPLKSYAYDLDNWYQHVGTVNGLKDIDDRNAARTVPIGLCLSNSGTIAASKVEFELWVTPAARVSTSIPSRRWTSYPDAKPAPIPSPDLGLPVPRDTKPPIISVYNLSGDRGPKIKWPRTSDDINLYKSEDRGDGSQYLEGSYQSLRHGQGAIRMRFFVIFGEHEASDIEIRYRLFAENQRHIREDTLRIKVTEFAV